MTKRHRYIGLLTIIFCICVILALTTGGKALAGWICAFAGFYLAAVLGFPGSLLWYYSPPARRQRLRQFRISNNLCLHCGYDLRAHKPGDRCPECGTSVDLRSTAKHEYGSPKGDR